jgi:hypothetical protein
VRVAWGRVHSVLKAHALERRGGYCHECYPELRPNIDCFEELAPNIIMISSDLLHLLEWYARVCAAELRVLSGNAGRGVIAIWDHAMIT